jgi:hypothetical protein
MYRSTPPMLMHFQAAYLRFKVNKIVLGRLTYRTYAVAGHMPSTNAGHEYTNGFGTRYSCIRGPIRGRRTSRLNDRICATA